jgi:hypothetical protein
MYNNLSRNRNLCIYEKEMSRYRSERKGEEIYGEEKRETSKGHCVPSLNFPDRYGRVKTLHAISGLSAS